MANFSAFSGGFKEGVDMGSYQEQTNAQTSLLSTQAEAARMKLGAAKTEQALNLAKSASLTAEQSKHADWDMSQTEGQLKVLGAAIQGAKDKPELQAKLLEDQKSVRQDMINSQLNAAKFQEAQRTMAYETATAALIDPRAGAEQLRTMATEMKNPMLAQLADVYEDKKPIKMFSDKENPNGKLMSQLSPDETEKFRAEMARNMGPQKAEKTASDYHNEQLKLAEINRKHQADLEKAAKDRSDAAAKREKLAQEAKKTSGKTDEKTKVAEAKLTAAEGKEINIIDEKQNKLLADAGVEDVSEKDSHWWGTEFPKLPLAKQAQYKRYETQKELVRQQHEQARQALHGSNYIPPKEIVASSDDKVVGKTPDGKDVYQTKDGKKYTK